ncbi:hypothetical protein HYS47_01445 [Candidatus Woesearchaeota archaeon]|nr:hypothetical protein [Candidatus Woesearchaeota archaeon]
MAQIAQQKSKGKKQRGRLAPTDLSDLIKHYRSRAGLVGFVTDQDRTKYKGVNGEDLARNVQAQYQGIPIQLVYFNPHDALVRIRLGDPRKKGEQAPEVERPLADFGYTLMEVKGSMRYVLQRHDGASTEPDKNGQRSLF